MGETAARPDHDDGNVYRCLGSLTIARAASTQREIDAMRDPMTIDISDVEKMDTVGAWLLHRAVRDRNATIIGASKDAEQLLEQVADADHPAQVRPDQRAAPARALEELGAPKLVSTGMTGVYTMPKIAKASLPISSRLYMLHPI